MDAEVVWMRTRRLGHTGHDSSVVMYGGAMLSSVTQEVADRSIREAIDLGVNHVDVAASYGDAEERLGPTIPAIREQIFLATKTELRDAGSAYQQVTESLRKLRTDHVDLIQLHAVGDLEELDKVTRRGGALEAAVRAQQEGLARHIGITGHSHTAPATHLEALRRFDFDTVLTPLNWVLGQREDYYRDFRELAGETRRRDVGLMVIKSGARRLWPGEERPYSTWYEPLTDQERITAAVAWVLSHEDVTAVASPSDVRLLPAFVRAQADGERLSAEAAAEVLRGTSDYSSPFLQMSA